VLIGRLHSTLAEKGDKVPASTPDPEWSPGLPATLVVPLVIALAALLLR